jgi:hypothetical protein
MYAIRLTYSDGSVSHLKVRARTEWKTFSVARYHAQGIRDTKPRLKYAFAGLVRVDVVDDEDRVVDADTDNGELA